MHASAVEVREVRLCAALMGRGLAAVVFGMVAMAGPWPRIDQTAVAFAVYLVVDAVLSTYSARRVRLTRGHPRLLAILGVVDLVTAVVVVVAPAVLPLRLAGGIRAVATGLCDARWSRRHAAGDLLTLAGVAAVVLGVVLLGWPGPGSAALPWLLGIQVMVSGSFLVAGALSAFRQVTTASPLPA